MSFDHYTCVGHFDLRRLRSGHFVCSRPLAADRAARLLSEYPEEVAAHVSIRDGYARCQWVVGGCLLEPVLAFMNRLAREEGCLVVMNERRVTYPPKAARAQAALWEQMTDQVKRAAGVQAGACGNDYVGTEHLLLAAASQVGTVAAWLLKTRGVPYEKLREAIARIVAQVPGNTVDGKRPCSPRAKKVLEYAIDEAQALGHNYVSAEHLLLGLLREKEGIAFEVIRMLGGNVEEIRRTVLEGLKQV